MIAILLSSPFTIWRCQPDADSAFIDLKPQAALSGILEYGGLKQNGLLIVLKRGFHSPPQSREDVFRIYWNIQEENEKKKLTGKRVCGYIGGIPVYETYIIDDTDPAATR